MLASAHHFPVPILEPLPRPSGCHHLLSPVSDPLDSGWTQLQISQFPLVGKAGVRSGEQALGFWS